MSEEPPFERLCHLYGIALEYFDVFGQRQRASQQTQQALLRAMGVPTQSEAALLQAIDAFEAHRGARILPPVQVLGQGEEALNVPLTISASVAASRLRWALIEENGARHEGESQLSELATVARGESFVRLALPLPPRLGLGYHQLEASLEGTPELARMTLIVAPKRCYWPEALAGGRRICGPTLPLYAVRSQRDWGIGDFSTLVALVEIAASLGADLIGLNPLHALFPDKPSHASPYSPSSRRFLNVLYIDVEAVLDLAECAPARARVEDPGFQARLRAQRSAELVDYEGVAATKLLVLELLYRHFREAHLRAGSGRGRAFRAYQRDSGAALRQHALFEALQERFHREDPAVWGWPAWPEPYRDPASRAVAAFAAEQEERIEYFEYLQWQAELQLDRAGRCSLERGLGVGLYLDLALGVDGGGADAWAEQDVYAFGARIGCPPDEVNPKGQDWGLPPFHPERLREAAYAPWIA
ncbi:MAG: 4-alpha-glucanotransferase, partial [Gammaproteobacteria bacterium]